MIFSKEGDKKAFCKVCVFFKQFDTTNGKFSTEGSKYCEVCAQWESEDIPVARVRTITNIDCHLILNEKNGCPFYSEEKVSEDQLKKLRIACKLKMAK